MKTLKYILIGIGIGVLIVLFFILRNKFLAAKLQKLLKYKYKNNLKNIEKKLKNLNKKINKLDDSIIQSINKVEELKLQKRKVHHNVKILSGNDLISAIDAWYKSR